MLEPRRLRRTPPFLAALFIAGLFLGSPATAQDQPSCAVPPPLPSVIDVRRPDQAARPGSEEFDQELSDYQDSVRGVRRFLSFVAQASDAAVAAPDGAVVDCLGQAFQRELRQRRLLDKTSAMQSGYEQHWALASLSLAAFKLQRAGKPLPAPALDWLVQIAHQVMKFHDQHGQLNNHVLWAALGVGTTGYLSGQADLVQWANTKVSLSLATALPDGILPRELSRGAKASHYHFFAAQPLMLYADIRTCFGDPMPEPERATIARVEGVLRHIIADPQWLAARAGARQNSVGNVVWLDALESGRVPASVLNSKGSSRLGGRLSNLVAALSCAR
ncbi:alginate lyase family protein [Ancylobacter oerskovii]|uniref:Alginate lyase family protein n=1 Tax=Ancylobacter oerskovii TaxID=459519 RepID=A0ABW4Z181_9HYPH|nr:alginate lyase family protein [Ancylobacter oerskovii]MBS7545052.1 alginate lyase family protein [Ancylobacter oerskovii]